MPRIFSLAKFANYSDKVKQYADKHSPIITCEEIAVRDQPFKVKVRIGINTKHPNTLEHHYEYIQLWTFEKIIGEYRVVQSAFGEGHHIETEFTVIPKLNMQLTAMAYCNKHGLWQSEEVFIKVID